MTAPRFIAILGTPHPAIGEAPISGLAHFPCDNGPSLWASEHIIRIGGVGAVIGHLFTRTLPSTRVAQFTPGQIQRIIDTSGASLLRDFWGGYVAILRRGDGEFLVLRDPSGALPAFWVEDRDRVIVASEVRDVQLVSEKAVSIDRERLAAFLWAPHDVGAQTCLAGVREILGGERLAGQNESWRTSQLWSPWDHVAPGGRWMRADHGDELRETIFDCVRAWGDCFSSVVLGLSGGLDSSIVAAGLRHSSAYFRCLTMIGQGADGDERYYAGIVTGTYGLHEAHRHYRLDDIDPARGFMTQLPWPTATLFTQGIAATHHRLHRERPIDAVFTGNGGDMVFCSMHSVTPLVDRLRTRAAPSTLWRTALDIGEITGADALTIFRKAIARAVKRHAQSLPGGDATFLDPELLASARGNAESHPWLCPPDGILLGRAAHVAMIKRSQIGHEFYPRATGPVSVAPLLSQPIVELCLAIPSWEWISGGVDRAAVRRACQGALPPAILQRRSKGGPGGFMQHIYHHKSDEIAELLASGALRRLGVLDRKLGPADLAVPPGTASPVPARLMMLAAADAWAETWPVS